ETPLERQKSLHESSRAFTEALDGLAARLDGPLAARVVAAEGGDVESKLAAIALDRKARPDRYGEIERGYVEATIPYPRPRGTTTPRLSNAHATEAYRLPWEFVLLRPPGDASSQAWERALKALELIRNDASTPTLTRLYRATCRDGITTGQVDTIQTR